MRIVKNSLYYSVTNAVVVKNSNNNYTITIPTNKQIPVYINTPTIGQDTANTRHTLKFVWNDITETKELDYISDASYYHQLSIDPWGIVDGNRNPGNEKRWTNPPPPDLWIQTAIAPTLDKGNNRYIFTGMKDFAVPRTVTVPGGANNTSHKIFYRENSSSPLIEVVGKFLPGNTSASNVWWVEYVLESGSGVTDTGNLADKAWEFTSYYGADHGYLAVPEGPVKDLSKIADKGRPAFFKMDSETGGERNIDFGVDMSNPDKFPNEFVVAYKPHTVKRGPTLSLGGLNANYVFIQDIDNYSYFYYSKGQILSIFDGSLTIAPTEDELAAATMRVGVEGTYNTKLDGENVTIPVEEGIDLKDKVLAFKSHDEGLRTVFINSENIGQFDLKYGLNAIYVNSANKYSSLNENDWMYPPSFPDIKNPPLKYYEAYRNVSENNTRAIFENMPPNGTWDSPSVICINSTNTGTMQVVTPEGTWNNIEIGARTALRFVRGEQPTVIPLGDYDYPDPWPPEIRGAYLNSTRDPENTQFQTLPKGGFFPFSVVAIDSPKKYEDINVWLGGNEASLNTTLDQGQNALFIPESLTPVTKIDKTSPYWPDPFPSTIPDPAKPETIGTWVDWPKEPGYIYLREFEGMEKPHYTNVSFTTHQTGNLILRTPWRDYALEGVIDGINVVHFPEKDSDLPYILGDKDWLYPDDIPPIEHPPLPYFGAYRNISVDPNIAKFTRMPPQGTWDDKSIICITSDIEGVMSVETPEGTWENINVTKRTAIKFERGVGVSVILPGDFDYPDPWPRTLPEIFGAYLNSTRDPENTQFQTLPEEGFKPGSVIAIDSPQRYEGIKVWLGGEAPALTTTLDQGQNAILLPENGGKAIKITSENWGWPDPFPSTIPDPNKPDIRGTYLDRTDVSGEIQIRELSDISEERPLYLNVSFFTRQTGNLTLITPWGNYPLIGVVNGINIVYFPKTTAEAPYRLKDIDWFYPDTVPPFSGEGRVPCVGNFRPIIGNTTITFKNEVSAYLPYSIAFTVPRNMVRDVTFMGYTAKNAQLVVGINVLYIDRLGNAYIVTKDDWEYPDSIPPLSRDDIFGTDVSPIDYTNAMERFTTRIARIIRARRVLKDTSTEADRVDIQDVDVEANTFTLAISCPITKLNSQLYFTSTQGIDPILAGTGDFVKGTALYDIDIFAQSIVRQDAKTIVEFVPNNIILHRIGTIAPFVLPAIDRTSWLLLDGSVIARSQYPELFKALGINEAALRLDMRDIYIKGANKFDLKALPAQMLAHKHDAVVENAGLHNHVKRAGGWDNSHVITDTVLNAPQGSTPKYGQFAVTADLHQWDNYFNKEIGEHTHEVHMKSEGVKGNPKSMRVVYMIKAK